MRIGMFTNNYLPRVSGPANSIENLSQALRRLGHQVYIFAPKYPKATKSAGFVYRFPSLRWSGKVFPPMALDFSPKLNKFIGRLELDIIHTHHPFWLGQIALRYAERLNVPLVFTQHAFYHKYPQEFLGLPVKPLEKLIARASAAYLKNCDLVVAPSQAVKETLRAANPKAAIQVIPFGINLAHFSPNLARRRKWRRQLGIQPTEIILLCVARLAFEKNVDFLLTALAALLKARRRVKLFLVGDGLAKPMLKSATRKLGLNRQVFFPGAVEYARLPDWYRAADIFVYPSVFETQGLALIEALASGLPVVVRESAVAKEYIKSGESGLIVPADNTKAFAASVSDLLAKPAKARRLGRAASRFAQRFDHLRSARAHVRIYKQLAALRRHEPGH